MLYFLPLKFPGVLRWEMSYPEKGNVKSNVMSPAAGTVPEDRKNDPGDKNINI